MSREGEDVCEVLGDLLKDEGIDIALNAGIKRVSAGDSVSVVFDQNGSEKALTGSHLLVATGRISNTEGST